MQMDLFILEQKEASLVYKNPLLRQARAAPVEKISFQAVIAPALARKEIASDKFPQMVRKFIRHAMTANWTN
jgi:hypothetical protein